MTSLRQYDSKLLRLMKYGPIIRRGDRWRFGTKTIGDSVVDRMVANGRAVRDGEQVIACQRPEGER